MRIYPLSNGKQYGWSKTRSILDFFFPYKENGDFKFIRCEASTGWMVENGKLIIDRKFYTFRAVVVHCVWTLVVNPIKALIRAYKDAWSDRGFNLSLARVGAIALDTSTAGTTGSGTSINFSPAHTCSGSNRILFVGAGQPTPTDNITTITYNAVATTNANKVVNAEPRWTYLNYLVAPATGSNTTTINASPSSDIGGVAISYTGASQTGQPDATDTSVAVASASVSTDLVTIADNCWTIQASKNNAGNSITSADGTVRQDFTGMAFAIIDSNVAKPIGSTTLTATLSSGSGTFGAVMASFSPAPSTASTATLTLMGV